MKTSISQDSAEIVRLLIVDDHDTVREGLRAVLTNTAIRVVAAAIDGESALDLVREEEIDIVLLDIGLPDRNGLDVLGQIKCTRPELAVLMHSVHDSRFYVQRSLDLGADGFLAKPVATKNDLLAAIHNAIRKARAASAVLG